MKNVIIKYLITSISAMGAFSGGNLSKNESLDKGIHFSLNKEEELANYTDPTDGEISVKVSQNATTELSQFYSLNFRTVDLLFSSARTEYKGISLFITDGGFLGEVSDYKDDPEVKPVLEAEVYSIDGSLLVNEHTAVIPSTVSYLTKFDLKITGIRSNCLVNPESIETIFIPDSVELINDDSFAGISSTTKIECVSSADKSGWEAGWNGAAEVTYSSVDRNASISSSKRNFPLTTLSNNGCQFFIGYYAKDNVQALKLMYDVSKNGVIETRMDDFTKSSKNNNEYDAVGDPIGSNTEDLSITIHLEEGEVVLDDSLYVCNFYKSKLVPALDEDGKVKKDDDGNIIYKNYPDFETAFKMKVKNKCERLYLKDFISIKPSAISMLGNYTELEITTDVNHGIYERVKPGVYNQYQDKIADGTCKVRYRFTQLPEASYRISYTSGDETKVAFANIDSPSPYFNIEKDDACKIGFLIKNSDIADDFDPRNIKRIDLMDFYMAVDVFSYETNNPVSAQSSYAVKFGIATLYNKETTEIKSHNLDLALTLIIILSISLYAGIAVGLFFLFKNMFKNDEFRRLNPKAFIKKALIYFIGFAFIVASLTTIIFRWGFVNNSIVVFNPIDAFVIIFTVGGLISLGLFIKELVVYIRVSTKRKSDKNLKIGEIAEEDGTK